MPDDLLWRYFELLSFRPLSEVEDYRAAVQNGANPQDYKKLFAEEIITRFHDAAAAADAHKSAGNRVGLGEIPENVPEVRISLAGRDAIHIVSLLKEAGLAQGKAAKDVFGRGAVYMNGEQLTEEKMFAAGDDVVLQAGKKKIARVLVAD